jgi:hypothetical protein
MISCSDKIVEKIMMSSHLDHVLLALAKSYEVLKIKVRFLFVL